MFVAVKCFNNAKNNEKSMSIMLLILEKFRIEYFLKMAHNSLNTNRDDFILNQIVQQAEINYQNS